MDESERKDAEDMLRMKVNKKLLQQHLSEVTGKTVILKDLTNIQTGLSSHCDGNDLKALVNRLEKIEGNTLLLYCTCHVHAQIMVTFIHTHVSSYLYL